MRTPKGCVLHNCWEIQSSPLTRPASQARCARNSSCLVALCLSTNEQGQSEVLAGRRRARRHLFLRLTLMGASSGPTSHIGTRPDMARRVPCARRVFQDALRLLLVYFHPDLGLADRSVVGQLVAEAAEPVRSDRDAATWRGKLAATITDGEVNSPLLPAGSHCYAFQSTQCCGLRH